MTQEVEQRTIVWRMARLGKWNASEVGNLMKAGRSKADVFGETAKTYILKVAAERLLAEEWKEDYCLMTELHNNAVTWGTEHEQEARSYYIEQTGRFVVASGGGDHLKCALRASPDGIIMENGTAEEVGLIEIKCPYTVENSLKQMSIKTAEELNSYNILYYWQVMAQMAVVGAQWCDWVTYDPRLQKKMSILRVERDDEQIAQLLNRIELAEEYIKGLY